MIRRAFSGGFRSSELPICDIMSHSYRRVFEPIMASMDFFSFMPVAA